MLVLALTVFAASPVAHDWLHHDDAATHAPETAEDTCAVVLFAAGVCEAPDRVEVLEPGTVAQAITPATAADVYLVSPRYFRQPERGPPLS